MKRISPADAALRYTGRIDFADPEFPTFVQAGSSIHARFTGTHIAVRARNRHNYWENSIGFCIDGREGKIVLAEDGETRDYVLADGLTNGTHELAIWKRSDGGLYYFDFGGFLVGDGERAIPAGERPARRIECFGDSVSAGEVCEAVAYTGKKDPDPHNGVWSNTWHSYAFQTARNLGAEIHNNSQGGIAVLPGTGFFANGEIGLVSTWDKLRYNLALGPVTPWDFSRWTPHVVIMALGQNDKHPDDYMERDPEKRERWISAYADIIRDIRSKYPAAFIVVITTLLEHPASWDDALDEIAARLADSRVARFRFSRNGTGTPGHLRVGENAEMAYELTNFLASYGQSIWE